MSGPVTEQDTPTEGPDDTALAPVFEVTSSHTTVVGRAPVRRALPRRARRTVGAWCFVDHFGPVSTEDGGIDVGPHPHIGLQTVTWLFAGEALHRDSLGSEQLIRPGQLNLMTAGNGVAHAEEGTGYRGELHGLQLWVAQPAETRHGDAAFEHHDDLPVRAFGAAEATVLVGELDGSRSPARRDTGHLGVDLEVHGPSELPMQPAHEHAVVVVDGSVEIEGKAVEPGFLAYLGTGRDQLSITGGTGRALLLGGPPFGEEVVMWWNFVGRSREELGDAYVAWQDADETRFGATGSRLERLPAPVPPWLRR